MSINAIKKPVNNVQKSQAVRYDTVKVNNEAVKSAALKGLLLKQHIKKQETIEEFPVENNAVTVSFRGFEIHTLRVLVK